MLQSCLGLGFDAERIQIRFDEPVLPAFLEEVTIRNLVLDGGSADVTLRRSRSQVVVDVQQRRGPVRVVTTT